MRLRSRDAAKELWKCVVLEHVRFELHTCLAPRGRTGRSAAVSLHRRQGPHRPHRALLLALADAEPEAIAYDYAMSSANLRDGYLKRYADADPQRILEALRCPEEGPTTC